MSSPFITPDIHATVQRIVAANRAKFGHDAFRMEATEPALEAPTPAPEAPAQETPKETDWKAEARKWEQRAKENTTAAQRLKEIEDRDKSELQKAAEAREAAEKAAAEAKSEALSLRISTEHKLGTEDAALIAAMPDEASMRSLATRLAAKEVEQKKKGNQVPREGSTPENTGEGVGHEFVRALFAKD